jgi:hypothetical protein
MQKVKGAGIEEGAIYRNILPDGGRQRKMLLIMGSRTLKREYPWGTAEAFNPNHSDLQYIAQALFKKGKHMKELFQLTETKTMQVQKELVEKKWIRIRVMCDRVGRSTDWHMFILCLSLLLLMVLSVRPGYLLAPVEHLFASIVLGCAGLMVTYLGQWIVSSVVSKIGVLQPDTHVDEDRDVIDNALYSAR